MEENKIRLRSEIPVEDKWAIEDLYASDAAWEAELETIVDDQSFMAGFAGSLGKSAEKLLCYLQRMEQVNAKAELLANYCMRKSDEDTREGTYQAMVGKFMNVIVGLSAATSFETPELMAITDEQLERFMEAIKEDVHWHDFFYLEITTGLRRGELCGLMWTDFDGKRGTLTIRRTLHNKEGGGYYVGDTKTGAGRRTIKLPPSTVQLLTERKKKSISQWIFPNPIRPEDPVMPNSGYARMKKILALLGAVTMATRSPSRKIKSPLGMMT